MILSKIKDILSICKKLNCFAKWWKMFLLQTFLLFFYKFWQLGDYSGNFDIILRSKSEALEHSRIFTGKIPLNPVFVFIDHWSRDLILSQVTFVDLKLNQKSTDTHLYCALLTNFSYHQDDILVFAPYQHTFSNWTKVDRSFLTRYWKNNIALEMIELN